MSRATTKETTGRGKYDSRHRGIYAIETNRYQYECGQETELCRHFDFQLHIAY